MRTPRASRSSTGTGAPIGDVRISVTDRCNFRCQYCMPAEGLPWLSATRCSPTRRSRGWCAILSEMGVHDVRLTGGEPLVRKELWRLVEAIYAIPGVHDLSLTTNGYLLEAQVADLVAAGLRRVNVSLDALAADRFFQLTRRDSLHRVLAGLEAAQAHPELRPIKVNAVALRGFTEDEVLRFARVRAREALRGALHRVHAARRRPGRGTWTRCCPAPRSRRSSRPSTSSSRSGASATAPRAATRSPTATARSASSPPSPSRSAATATASA